MKNLRKNTLLMLLLGAATVLTACNSGGPGPNSNNGNNNANTSLAEKSIGEEEGLPNVVNMILGGFETKIGGEAASWLLDEISGGSFPPASPNQLIVNINNQLTQIEKQITGTNQLVTQVLEKVNEYQYQNQDEILNTYENKANTIYDNFDNWLASSLPQQYAVATESSFSMGSTSPISESALAFMVSNQGNITSAVGGDFSELDRTEQNLSCDNASQYSVANPSVHSTPSLNLGQGATCAPAQVLSSAITSFEAANPITVGTNAFQSMVAFNTAMDFIYLGMVQALTHAYQVDQLRVYIGENVGASISIPSVVYGADASNYNSALADVTYAYNQRLGYLNTLFSQAKQEIFNYYTSAQAGTNIESINSTSMINNCGLTYQNIENSLNSNANSYYWDGNNLTATCLTNIPGRQQITSTVNNLPTLCVDANLQVSNGYISCGPSVNNYVVTQSINAWNGDNNNSAPTVNLYSNENNYNGGSNDQLYSFFSGGHLDVSYDPAYPLTSNGVYPYVNSGYMYLHYAHQSPTGFIAYDEPKSGWNFENDGNPTIMNIVDDGVHAYLIGAGGIYVSGQDNQGFMVLGCIPGDSNCIQGNFPNPNSPTPGQEGYNALVFSNGDVISMYNEYTGSYHGDYYIKNYYNGTAFNQLDSNGNQYFFPNYNLQASFPNVSYN